MRTRMQGRVLRTLTSTLLLALLAALLLAGSALATPKPAKPGKPTAKAPKCTIASAKPAFTWSKASRAARYELRVYKGSELLLKKTGLKKTTWKAVKALPANVALTWRVRASNARGAGAWSRSLAFRIVPPGPEKALTAFGFAGLAPPVVGTIDEAAHTIALTVPYGTDVTALVATFTTTGASVAVAGTPQESGVTANDFTSPVTYTVTAADGTTQDYLVTVTVAAAPLAIGDAYGGGIIAYIDGSGVHGLIAATADQTPADSGIQWATEPYWNISVPGALGTAIGTGAANTDAIIAQNGAGATYAAGLARAYDGGGYSDWYLPSKDELNQLYLNRVAIGGFHTVEGDWPYYWSSSQCANTPWDAIYQACDAGGRSYNHKGTPNRLRAVRTF